MAFPLIPLAIGTGVFKLGSSLLSGLGKNKEAKALYEAQRRAFAAQSAAHSAKEGNRAARLDAAAGALQAGQGALQAGAPNYTISPEVLARIKAPIPFAGSMPADPRAGGTYRLLSGLTGGVGDIGRDMILGHLAGQGGGIEGGVPEGVVGGIMDDPLERVKAICKAFPESCAGYMGS